jgi:protein gp37
MATTTIQWTNKTWNPTVGCTRISPGCKFCYAFALHDKRHAAYKAGKKIPAQYAKPFTELQMIEDRLTQPLRWRKPCRIFVNSVSDLFHEDVPDEFIAKCFAVMLLSQRHTFQILTKRPERMRRFVGAPNFGETIYDMAFHLSHMWAQGHLIDAVPEVSVLPNVWCGVSAEDQPRADARIPLLLKTPAAVRFVSFEPLLSAITMDRRHSYCPTHDFSGGMCVSACPDLVTMDWALIGGESGHGARRCDIAWIRSLVKQCQDSEIAPFVKQLGSRPYQWDQYADGYGGITGGGGDVAYYCQDRKGGDMEEWPSDLRVREYPAERTTA